MSWIYKALAGVAAAAAAIFGALFALSNRQREKAEARAARQERRAESGEARLEQRRRADEASNKAKEEGDARVEKVRDEARSGDRRHFESDRLRDDD